MKQSKISLMMTVVGVCVLLLLGGNYLAGVLSPESTALDAALAECRAKGWQNNELAQTGLQISTSALGSAATIVLKPKDREHPNTIRVQLRKRINLMSWQVVGYEEE